MTRIREEEAVQWVYIIYTASLTNGNWVDNVIIWYSSVVHQNQQYHSASLQWLHIWNHSRVRIQELIISILRHPIFHFSHSVTSQKVSRSPTIIFTIYQAISSARHGRQSPPVHHQLSTLCGLRRLLLPTPQPRRFAVNAIMWLPKPKTGFGLSQNQKTGFTEGTRFLRSINIKEATVVDCRIWLKSVQISHKIKKMKVTITYQISKRLV